MKMQVGDKNVKMFISVCEIGEAGNMTIFNADMNAIRALAKRENIEEHFIYNKKRGIGSKINRGRRIQVLVSNMGRKEEESWNVWKSLQALQWRRNRWICFRRANLHGNL